MVPPRRRSWPLVVRRATPADTPAVLEFASGTWDGWDYIPHALPVWLDAPDGVVLVGVPGPNPDGGPPLDAEGRALAADRAIAVARVAWTSPAEAWLEGIRVDPRVRGMDVATDLQVAELHSAVAHGASVVRYATGQHNEGSHRLGARHGFTLLTSLRTYWWTEGDDDSHDEDEANAFDPAARAEATARRQATLAALAERGLVARASDGPVAERLWQRVSADPAFAAAAHLYEHRAWALQELSREGFLAHLGRGEVLMTGEADGAAWASAILPGEALPAEDVSLHLGLLLGGAPEVVALASAIRAAAGASIRFRLPDASPTPAGPSTEDLAAAGFKAREWTLDILGRRLDAGHPPPPMERAALIVEDENSSPAEI